MISGATGALAVVMVALVVQHGIEYLFATVVMISFTNFVCSSKTGFYSYGSSSGNAKRISSCNIPCSI